MIIDDKRRALPIPPCEPPVAPTFPADKALAPALAPHIPAARPYLAYDELTAAAAYHPVSPLSSISHATSTHSTSSRLLPHEPTFLASTHSLAQPPPLAVTRPRGTSLYPHPQLMAARSSSSVSHLDKPGAVIPNLLLLPGSQYALSQPQWAAENSAYPVARQPDPVHMQPDQSAYPDRLSHRAAPYRRLGCKHEMRTRYGAGGCVLSVICFPVGLFALLYVVSSQRAPPASDILYQVRPGEGVLQMRHPRRSSRQCSA
jgi:hypothetical protein